MYYEIFLMLDGERIEQVDLLSLLTDLVDDYTVYKYATTEGLISEDLLSFLEWIRTRGNNEQQTQQ